MSDTYENHYCGAVHSPTTTGPCRVGSIGDYWCVFNDRSRTVRKIGRIGAKRQNYFDKAMTYAEAKNREYAGGMHMKKETTIRELHTDSSLTLVKSLFYLALEKAPGVEVHGDGCLDKRIAFTFDGQEIDFIPVLEHFHASLGKFIEKEALQRCAKQLDDFERLMQCHIERLRDAFVDFKWEAFRAGLEEFDREDTY